MANANEALQDLPICAYTSDDGGCAHNVAGANARYCKNHATPLQRAIEQLGAVEVAPGRYAWLDDYDDNRAAWLVTSATVLSEDFDATSDPIPVWREHSTEMPASWKPGDPLPEGAL
jgi:hypothetical protein